MNWKNTNTRSKKLIFDYDKNFTIEARKGEAERVISKYPERIPIICEKAKGNVTLGDVDKIKYLVPSDMTIGQFLYVIRKKLKLPAEKAIFLCTGSGIMCSTTKKVSEVYDEYKCEREINKKEFDGFLKIIYDDENVFG
jgi:GABA(A) receptor-associated protein